ncbi:4445_t:CDS:2 [Gigaspora margarita]|uniref:4445_t:CDS:1 n=1 Tax=Gigaspora margarita TaxID=4874 RepID=A0ABN7VL89_GIGMA|nr:4445_t:CDS:2 [Gigaspora margarita]
MINKNFSNTLDAKQISKALELILEVIEDILNIRSIKEEAPPQYKKDYVTETIYAYFIPEELAEVSNSVNISNIKKEIMFDEHKDNINRLSTDINKRKELVCYMKSIKEIEVEKCETKLSDYKKFSDKTLNYKY